MEKLGIFIFMKVVDSDVTFQIKLTLLKLEWQNTKYGRKTEDRSKTGNQQDKFLGFWNLCI